MAYRNILVIGIVSMIMPYTVYAGAICANGESYTVIEHDLSCVKHSLCDGEPRFINTCGEQVTLADVTCSDTGLNSYGQEAGFEMTNDGLVLSNTRYSGVQMSLHPKSHGQITASVSWSTWYVGKTVNCSLNSTFFDEKTKVMTLHFKKGDEIYTSKFFIPSAPDEVDNWWKYQSENFWKGPIVIIVFASPGIIALLLVPHLIRRHIRIKQKK